METQNRAAQPITTRRAHTSAKSPAVGPSSRPDVASQRSVTVRKICQNPLRCLNGPGLHSHLVQVPRTPQEAATAIRSSTTKQSGSTLKRSRPEILQAEVSVEKRVRARDEQQQQQQQQLRDMPQSESVAMPAVPPAEAVGAPSRPDHDEKPGESRPPKEEGPVRKSDEAPVKTVWDWGLSEMKRFHEQRAADARAEGASAADEKRKPEPRLRMLNGREDAAKVPVEDNVGNVQWVAQQIAPAYISPNPLSGASLGNHVYPYAYAHAHAHAHAYSHWHPIDGEAAGSSTNFPKPLATAGVRAPWTGAPVPCASPSCVQQAVRGPPSFPADVSAGGRDTRMCLAHHREVLMETERRMRELEAGGQKRRDEEDEKKEQPEQPKNADTRTFYNVQEAYRELLDKLVRWQISTTEGVQAIKDELGRLTVSPASATAPEAETGRGPFELDAIDTEISPGADEAEKARKAGGAGRSLGPETSLPGPDGFFGEDAQRWVSTGLNTPGKPGKAPIEHVTLSTLLADAKEAPASGRRPRDEGAGEVASLTLALPALGGDEYRPWVQQSDVGKRDEERKNRSKARKRDEAKAKEDKTEDKTEAQSLAFDVVDASEGDNPGDEYVVDEVAAYECERDENDDDDADGATMCNVSRKETPEMA
ncbi:hypothetical protein CTA2_4006, partial [Colletotrichum tanaceti]